MRWSGLIGQSPRPLDEPVVDPAALAVHADLHAPVQQRAQPGLAGELDALVRVRDQRRSRSRSASGGRGT